MNGITVFCIVILVCVLAVILIYNKGINLKNYVSEAFSTMDVYLKKRWDLIPNLVETVKAYASHEKNLFEKTSEIRTKSYSEMSDNEKLDTNSQLGILIPKIIAVAENYPELRANQNFIKLMDNLNEVENDIANARKYYNGTVRELNTFMEIFPVNLIGSVFGIKKANFFEITDKERENVRVEL